MTYGSTRRECIYAFRGTDKSVPYIPFEQTDQSEIANLQNILEFYTGVWYNDPNAGFVYR